MNIYHDDNIDIMKKLIDELLSLPKENYIKDSIREKDMIQIQDIFGFIYHFKNESILI